MFCEVYHLYNLVIHTNSNTLFSCNIHEATVKRTFQLIFLIFKRSTSNSNSQVKDLTLSCQYNLPKNDEKIL